MTFQSAQEKVIDTSNRKKEENKLENFKHVISQTLIKTGATLPIKHNIVFAALHFSWFHSQIKLFLCFHSS